MAKTHLIQDQKQKAPIYMIIGLLYVEITWNTIKTTL